MKEQHYVWSADVRLVCLGCQEDMLGSIVSVHFHENHITQTIVCSNCKKEVKVTMEISFDKQPG